MKSYVDIVNNEKKEAVMRLYGEIGVQLDANLFALELASLDAKADTIHIHVNSPGGDVVSGLSIIAAMRSMKAFIHVHVDGLAASMAAVIAIAADRVSMQDYGKIMIHNPYPSDKEAQMNDKLRKALGSLTDTLQTILSRRGCKKERIGALMSAETWFTAEEAKTEGLIDEIVVSSRKEEFSNLTTTELLTRISNEYKPKISNDMDITKIAAQLGLPATATEQQILDEMAARDTSLQTQQTALVDHYVALGKANGIVTDKNEERMKKLAKADLDLFIDMVTAVDDTVQTEQPATVVQANAQGAARLSAAIAGLQGVQAGASSVKTWDWYQKNDPKALAKLETENPAQFKKLLDDYENSI